MKTDKQEKSEIEEYTFDEREESKISNTTGENKTKGTKDAYSIGQSKLSGKETENKDLKVVNEVAEYQNFNGYRVKLRKMFTEEKDKFKSENVYNGVELDVDSSFGVSNINIEKNGMFISEVTQTIIYPSGNHLVCYDLNTHDCEYICKERYQTSKITAIGAGLTKKRDVIIGVAEKDNSYDVSPRASVYSYEKRKWMFCDHDHITNRSEKSYIKQIIVPDFNKYCITLCITEGSAPFVSYFRYDRESVYRKSHVDERTTKIAINPFSHHMFIAIGNCFVRLYMANEKDFQEEKEPIIPNKYEKRNNFTDISYFPDSHSFILVSSQRNIFIVNGKSVVYVQFDQSPNMVVELTTKSDLADIDIEKANKEVEAEIEVQK